MAIQSLVRDYGVNPCIVRMLTSDSYSVITETNYLATQMVSFNKINGGSFQWAPSDVVLANYSDGWAFFTISPNFESLIPFAGDLPFKLPSSVLVTDVNSDVLWQGPMLDGQLIIGSTGGTPVNTTLTAGTNITITNTPGNITIESTGGGGGVTASQVQKSAFNFNTDIGATNAFHVNLSPAVLSLTDGLLVTMLANNFNTSTTPTLQVNALAPITIVNALGELAATDITTGGVYLFVYNAVANTFELINPSITNANAYLVQKNYFNYGIDLGAPNDYIINLPLLPLVILAGGLSVIGQMDATNTGPSTLTVNGDSANVVKSDGTALVGGEIIGGGIFEFVYSDNYAAWVLINPVVASSTPSVWQDITTATQTMVAGVSYIADYASGPVVFTLPASSAVGTVLQVKGGFNGLGWQILQNAGQQISVGNVSSTLGNTGYIQSTNNTDAVSLVCLVADTIWGNFAVQGSIDLE